MAKQMTSNICCINGQLLSRCMTSTNVIQQYGNTYYMLTYCVILKSNIHSHIKLFNHYHTIRDKMQQMTNSK